MVALANDLASPPPEDGAAQPPSTDCGVAKDVDHDKELSFIKAWEESRKSRVHNRGERKQAKVTAWENSKKASVEAQMTKFEERMERKKAEFAEKLRNKEAEIHKIAEEKRALVEASMAQNMIKVEEMAAKFRNAGHLPKMPYSCFKH